MTEKQGSLDLFVSKGHQCLRRFGIVVVVEGQGNALVIGSPEGWEPGLIWGL